MMQTDVVECCLTTIIATPCYTVIPLMTTGIQYEYELYE